MDRKVFVAIVENEGIGQQSVPSVAKVRMARDRARKANQAKGKLMMARRKAKVTNGKHARRLKGIAITVGNGVTWKRIVSQKPKPKGKGKNAGSLDESETSVPENTSVGGFGLCSFGNRQYDEWKWNDCRKVTFTLDSGAAVSVAPKSLGDYFPMVIEEPRLYKTATGEFRTR